MANKENAYLTDDPVIKNLFSRIPTHVQKSFNEEQLMHLKVALTARQWGNHTIDIRGSVAFFRNRYYYVIVAGKNKRVMSRKENELDNFLTALIATLFLAFAALSGLILIYILKSALGINLFESFSLGIWS